MIINYSNDYIRNTNERVLCLREVDANMQRWVAAVWVRRCASVGV